MRLTCNAYKTLPCYLIHVKTLKKIRFFSGTKNSGENAHFPVSWTLNRPETKIINTSNQFLTGNKSTFFFDFSIRDIHFKHFKVFI